MKIDDRLTQMAEQIVKKSIKVKKGEKVFIEGFSESVKILFNEVIKQVTKAGGVPFWYFNDNAFIKSFIDKASKDQLHAFGKMHAEIMKQCDAYVGIRGYDDMFLLSDVSEKQMELYQHEFYTPVHFEVRIPKTRWVVMRYPNNTMSALSRMSTEAFEDFYFKACLVDYDKMAKAMLPLKKLMDKTDKVKIIAPNTHLEFSIKGLKAVADSGSANLPDGEVYTAPVKDSINGVIQFNTDTVYEGEYFSNIRLEFKDGKIIKGTSMANNDKFQKLLNLDAGSRYMGEFALGLNPYITKPMLDILFDEKISGSLHMAIGNSYSGVTFNGNRSAIHWDLVLIQTAEKGGGEIWFDDKLIRKDGIFIPKELQGLNPENLK